MVIKLNIKSKNISSILHFITLIKKFYKVHNLDYSFFIVSKPSKRKMFSILKSPHVNKTSQEQFEIKTYNRECIIKTKNYLQFLLMFKKLNTSLFSDLRVIITLSIINNSNLNKFYLKKINSNYLKIIII